MKSKKHLLDKIKKNKFTLVYIQGRRWAFEKWYGHGMPSAQGTSGGGEHESRGGRGGVPHLVSGVRASPENIFEFKMCLEAILMHFETIFAQAKSNQFYEYLLYFKHLSELFKTPSLTKSTTILTPRWVLS